jgi:hypothetical protein
MKKQKREFDKINRLPRPPFDATATGGTSHIVPPRNPQGVLVVTDRLTVTHPTPTTCGLHGDHDALRFDIRPRES